MNKKRSKYFIFLFLVFSFHSRSFCAEILRFNKTSVLLSIEENIFEQNDLIDVKNKKNETIAVLKITQIKKKRALAQISKGSLVEWRKNDQLIKSKKLERADNKPDKKTKSVFKFGGSVIPTQNSVVTNLTSATAVSMNGSSYSGELFFDYALLSQFEVSARLGLNRLSATGATANGGICNAQSCFVSMDYLDSSLALKYTKSYTKFELWSDLGLGFLLPIQKDSNILTTADINTTQKFFLGLGAAYNLSNNYFVPVELEYSIFLNSQITQINQLRFKLGFGFGL